ncbi:MAG: glycine--tRNA ligase [Mycoplasmatales bacterium]|nr:glycine--tRNA ligase [Mycoplasmatales bacterium]
MENLNKNFQEIVTHLKEIGFVYQGSSIYGGLANTWDYGPLGALITKNIKDLWIKEFIFKEENNVMIDSKILMNTKVWEASGHVKNFSDPLIENKVNGKRYRADHIIESIDSSLDPENMSNEEMYTWITENVPKWENSKANWNKIREFHLMFETNQGVVVDSKSKVYLRPETAQGIFVNFMNVQRTSRLKIPFGIGQIGKSFRNEVTPGNFIFRTREFEQMELEYFVKPGEDQKAYEYYINKSLEFSKLVGLKESSIRLREHGENELAHYSNGTSDVEFLFPFGWGELMGIANRTDFDLKSHAEHSREKLEYRDPMTNKVYVPFVIEPSMGLDRLTLAALVDSYKKEEIDNDSRIVLKLDKKIAPYKFAVLPLNKKIHSNEAKRVFRELIDKGISVSYDESGSIGKRYRRQDSIGTPFVLTIIDETATENKVTIRDRDSMKQITISLDEINNFI